MVNDVIADPLAVANELRPVLLRLARELRKETEQLGITSRQVTLLWLVRVNPGMSLRELAAEEGISAPALSGHVDRLEKAGLLARVRDDADRRRVGLELTEEGRVERIDREIELTGPLDEAQRSGLLAVADRCPVHRTLGAEVLVESHLAS